MHITNGGLFTRSLRPINYKCVLMRPITDHFVWETQFFWKKDIFTERIGLVWKTRTKVVHKNVSQGWNKMKRSERKSITQPLHIMTLFSNLILGKMCVFILMKLDFDQKKMSKKKWICKHKNDLMWPLMTFEVILYFKKNERLHNVNIHINL